MQNFILHYYCYGCQSHLATHSSIYSCLSCDSNAIENSESEPSIQSLAEFKPFELTTPESQRPQGMLENTVNPRREQTLDVFSIVRPITHRIVIINLDDEVQQLRSELQRLRFIQALLGDIQEGVTEEEISKLDQLKNVLECSICQESHEKNINEMQDSDDEDQGGYRLKCGHIFHEGCIRPWFEKARTCPLCRKSINKQN